VPFALYDYNDAVESRCRVAIEALLPVVEPALRAFRVTEVEAVPTAHVPVDGDRSIELAPTHLDRTITFNVGCIRRGVDGDLSAVHAALLAEVRWLASARVAHMKRALDTITDATAGQVARVGREMTWESIMTAVETMPIGSTMTVDRRSSSGPRKRNCDTSPCRRAMLTKSAAGSS